jgi:predicted Rossmann fold flavoprotein
VVIGGGAAGHFAAAETLAQAPHAKVLICEASSKILKKVRISGGGRCNFTHACFDPKGLIKAYPRGGREMLGPFFHFGPTQTLEWFQARGCEGVVEADGRMFPKANTSEAIIEVLCQSTAQATTRCSCPVLSIEKEAEHFRLQLRDGTLRSKMVLMASGSSEAGYQLTESLGVKLVERRPSIFSLIIPGLTALAGTALEARITLMGQDHQRLHQETGPVLFTHKGLSGPALLKCTAWAARALYDTNYVAELVLDCCPHVDPEQEFKTLQQNSPDQSIGKRGHVGLTKKMWLHVLERCGLDPQLRWKQMGDKPLQKLKLALTAWKLSVKGKSPYKEEFVTCGGVDLKGVNFKTMESKVCPDLFFAGEVLNVDGITGGFNFQAAWTAAYLASGTMAERLS